MTVLVATAVVALACLGCTEDTSPVPTLTIVALPTGHDSALAGTDLEFVSRVQVTRPDGRLAEPGTVVTFTAADGGRVSGSPALVDAQGMAAPTAWRLGSAVGLQTMIATTGDGAIATLTAVATPRAQDGKYTTMTVGRQHACALTADGTAYCWGKNDDGQLGTGSRAARSSPVAVVGVPRLQKIVAGYEHTCGLATDGVLFCWGGNATGGIGDGTTTTRQLTPVQSAGALRFVDVAVGDGHTCGIATDGQTYCWGQNFGQLGDGSSANSAVPVVVTGNHRFNSIAAWQWLNCALDDRGIPYCWGRRSETGFSAFRSDTARMISGVSGLQSISTGDNHACGITTNAQTLCWAWSAGAIAARAAGPALRQISVGMNACGAAVGDGTIECLDASFAFDLPPRAIGSGLAVASTFVGGYQCALTQAGAPYCWGANDLGGLGTGSLSVDSRFPAAVRAP